MTQESCIDIEINGIYDGVCVKYYPKTGEFIWRPKAIERTTERERKDQEERWRDYFKNQIKQQ